MSPRAFLPPATCPLLDWISMNVGLIGWRGMVGSVLVQRMREERDFDLIEPVFFLSLIHI